ncbi:MAG: hypothetical protein PHT07_09030 [Paludibacter sp.]|nr:hypothetical protein [Paludibacter sp.]
MNKFLIVFLLITMICCTPKKDNLKYIICRDSAQYWESNQMWSDGKKYLNIKRFDNHRNFKSYWVDKLGNIRSVTDKYDNEDINSWSLTNDSILIINKIPSYKIIKCNLDTILLETIIGEKTIDTLQRLDVGLKVINKGDPGDTLNKVKLLAPI